MASSLITSCQIDRLKTEKVTHFVFLGSKITADTDCSHEIKMLAPWKIAMTNLDSILKSRDITLLKKVHLFKAMVFPGVMYGCESWTTKKKNAEHQRINAFELWGWRRLLRVLWNSRRSNKSIQKGINPDYSLEGLMLKLKLQYFGIWCEDLTHWKGLWCWERLKAWGEGGHWEWHGWMVSSTQYIGVWVYFQG